MNRTIPVASLFALVAALTVHAGDAKTGFVKKSLKTDDGESRYIVFVPKDYDGTKEFPIILFLHGSGSVGTDGDKQTKGGLAKAIRDKGQNFPFITIFPQADKNSWGPTSASGKRALAILDQVEKDYKTDKKRVYLTGLSLGGFGTWSLAAADPKRWAAIAPICGGGSPKAAKKIKDLPCWCFHGDADMTVNVEKSREMIKALKDAGGSPKYTEYPGVDHNSWDRAYATPGLYAWFLKQSTK